MLINRSISNSANQIMADFSLAKNLTGQDFLPLLTLMHCLSRLEPIPAETRENLERRIKNEIDQLNCKELSERTHAISHFIFNQFPDPALKPLGEVVSNAIDTQVRAKTENLPIHLMLNQQGFGCQDSGEGMDLTSLFYFLVACRTSNTPSAKEISHVAGNFGQGILSLFYLLLSDRTSSIPQFKIDPKDGLQLEIPFEEKLKKGFYRFSYSLAHRNVAIEVVEDPSAQLMIETTKHKETLHMIFINSQRQILCDIKGLESKKDHAGSFFWIRSPLITKNQDKIAQYLQKAFALVERTPIFLNGKKLNQLENFRALPVEGGTLYFDPSPRDHAAVLIYEKGRLIYEEQAQGFIFDAVSVNFHHLRLTPDRSTIDFKGDQQARLVMQNILTAIASHPLYPPAVKIKLFNSLYSLIQPSRFNLVSLVKSFYAELEKDSNHFVLPDIFGEDANKIPAALYLHPAYCPSIHLPFIQTDTGIKIYLMPKEATLHPIFAKNMHGVLHLFIRSDLLKSDDPIISKFNLLLINLWLEEKFHTNQSFHIDISAVLHQVNPTFTFSPALEEAQKEDDVFLTEEEIRIYNERKKLTQEDIMQAYNLKNEPESFNQHPEILRIFPKVWLLSSRTVASARSQTEKRESEQIEQDKIEWFSQFVCSSFGHYELLFENKFPNSRILHQVCSDASNLPFNSFCETIQMTFNFLKMVRNQDDKSNGEREAHQFLKFLSKTLNFKRGINHLQSLAGYVFECYQRYDSIKKLACLNEQQAEKFQAFEENFGEGNYQNIEKLIKSISNPQTRHIAASLYQHFYKQMTWLIELEPGKAEEVILLTMPLNISFQNTTKTYYKERLAALREISTADSVLLLKYLVPISNWPLETKKILAECFFLLELIKNEQFGPDHSLSHFKINEHLFFKVALRYLQPLPVQQASAMLDHAHTSLVRILHFCRERNQLHASYRIQVKSIHQQESFFEFNKPLISWLKYYPNAYAFSRSLEDHHSFLNQLSQITSDVEFESFIYQKQNQEIALWTSLRLISPNLWPLISAAFLGPYATFFNKPANYPLFSGSQAIPLHQDRDVCGYVGSESLAERWIGEAINQSLQDKFGLNGVIRNSLDAGAGCISVSGYQEDANHLVLIIKDDGTGIDEAGFKALKTPRRTGKQSKTQKNYGRSFFSIFQQFDDVRVQSSCCPNKQRSLHFKKEGSSLLVQPLLEESGTYKTGTTLILRKQSQQPLVDLILYRSHLINSCGFIKPHFYFQNTQMNIEIRPHAAASAEESYPIDGRQKGEIKAFLSLYDGLFVDSLKVNEVPEAAWNFVPQRIRRLIGQEQLKLSLFLPPVEQAMNGGHLINQQEIMPVIQFVVLKVSLAYLLKKLAEGKTEAQFSDDYWTDFRFFQTPHQLGAILTDWEAFWKFKQKIHRALKQDLEEQKAAILRTAESFLGNNHRVLTEANPSITSLIKSIQEEDVKRDTDEIHKSLISFFEANFNFILVEMPLIGSHSFLNIRSKIQEKLESNKILSKQQYNLAFIQQTPLDTLKNLIQASMISAKRELGLAEEVSLMLNRFEQAIKNRIAAMKWQQEQLRLHPSQADLLPLKNFLEKCAKQILCKHMQFFIYSAMDGTNAYTYPQTNQFHLNSAGEISLLFLDVWLKYKEQKAFSPQELDKTLTVIKEAIKLLTHERSHMDEPYSPNGCHSSHDQKFRDAMCRFIEAFFIKDGTKVTALRLFEEAFHSSMQGIEMSQSSAS